MSSTNKTSLGLNMWEASDKPVRQDFVNDNVIIDEKVTKLEQDLSNGNIVIDDKIAKLNSNLALKANASNLTAIAQKTLINDYAGNAGTNSYDLSALSAYLVICSTVGNSNVTSIAAYIVVAGGGIGNTGTISTLVNNSNFSAALTNGIKLAITSNTYHTLAIKQL
jgi:hypothetical protein